MKYRTLLFLPLFATSAFGASINWAGTTSGAWYTTTNWTGGVLPGSSSTTTNADIAVFNVALQPTVGINMATAVGNYYLGALDYTNATARNIGNSSGTAGVLTLNGATVNSVPDTIIRNSTSTLLTIQASQTGTMGLALGNATNNIIQATGTGGITISSIISGASKNLTLQGGGSGTLTLSGANTYSGTTTITSGAVSMANIGATPAAGIKVNTDGAIGGAAYSTLSAWIGSGKIDTTSTGALAITANSSETINFNAAGYSDLRLGAIGTATFSGTFTPGTAGAYRFGGTGILTYSPAISTGSVDKSGPGTLVIGVANSYSGGTTISNGPVYNTAAGTAAAITLGNDSALGTGSVTFSNTTNIGAFYTAGNRTISNNIALGSSAVTTEFITATNFSMELSGLISGGNAGGTLFMDNTTGNSFSVLKLSNSGNTFRATIKGNRGMLAITSNGALGDAANILDLDQTSNNGGLRFDANNIDVTHPFYFRSRFDFNVNGFDATLSGAITGTTTAQGPYNVRGGTLSAGNSTGSLRISGSNNSGANLVVGADTKLIAASVTALGNTTGSTTVSADGTLAFDGVGTYANAEPVTLNGVGVKSGGVGVGALQNLAGTNDFSGPITLASASTIGVTAGTLTLGGNVAGAHALTKTGTGTLNFNGTIAASSIIVSEGALGLGSPLTLATQTLTAGRASSPANDIIGSVFTGTGTLNVMSGTNVGTLTVSNNLSLSGGTVNLDLSSNSATGNDSIVVGGVLDLNAATTVNFNRLTGVLGAGTYVLAQAASTTGDIANVTFNGLPAPGTSRQTFTPALSATQLTLAVTGSSANLVWTNAAGTGNWSQDAANENWNNTSAPDSQDRFFASDLVQFSDITGQPTQTVTVSTDVEPGSISFDNSSGGTAYTLGGSSNITGSTGFTKTGTGTIDITGSNHTFTGIPNFNGGLVKVSLLDDSGWPCSLGQGTGLSFDGGTLAYDEFTDCFTNRAITLLAGGGTIRVGDAAATVTLSGVLGNVGGFTKTGDGTVLLTADNTYQGMTTISGGTLKVGSGGTTGSMGTGNVVNNGTLTVNRSHGLFI